MTGCFPTGCSGSCSTGSVPPKGFDLTNSTKEKRSELRAKTETFRSVEIKAPDLGYFYQFKIWDISTKGMCVLVREDSRILKKLYVNLVLDVKFYPSDPKLAPEFLKTEIRHITKEKRGRFKGHSLIGLLILENQEDE